MFYVLFFGLMITVCKSQVSNHSKLQNNTLLFEVAGNYKVEENDYSCQLQLKLFYKKGKLHYDAQTNSRKLNSEAELALNEKKDGYYLTLKNWEWSEYEGAIEMHESGEQVEKDLGLPKDIQGVLYKGEITIQNTGNAMNYYVKIGECDLKFIHLKKN